MYGNIMQIDGYPDYYVTDTGKVLSVRRPKMRELKQHLEQNGYMSVTLCSGIRGQGAKHKTSFIHSLILEEFVGKRSCGKQHARHKNGNPLDNRLDNLEWGTAQENANDRIKHGRSGKGEASPVSRLKNKDVISIRKKYANGVSAADLAKEYNHSLRNIFLVVKRETWQHI